MVEHSENKIGNTIREARTSKGMTQQELADQIGVIRQTITEYESGRIEPSVKILVKIMKVLDIKNFMFD